jgi:hypothetical protein
MRQQTPTHAGKQSSSKGNCCFVVGIQGPQISFWQVSGLEENGLFVEAIYRQGQDF